MRRRLSSGDCKLSVCQGTRWKGKTLTVLLKLDLGPFVQLTQVMVKESTAFILRLQATRMGSSCSKNCELPMAFREEYFKGGVRERASEYVISSCIVLID